MQPLVNDSGAGTQPTRPPGLHGLEVCKDNLGFARTQVCTGLRGQVYTRGYSSYTASYTGQPCYEATGLHGRQVTRTKGYTDNQRVTPRVTRTSKGLHQGLHEGYTDNHAMRSLISGLLPKGPEQNSPN